MSFTSLNPESFVLEYFKCFTCSRIKYLTPSITLLNTVCLICENESQQCSCIIVHNSMYIRNEDKPIWNCNEQNDCKIVKKKSGFFSIEKGKTVFLILMLAFRGVLQTLINVVLSNFFMTFVRALVGVVNLNCLLT